MNKLEVKGVLFVVRGLPGSGKTTAAEFLAGETCPVISADDFFYQDGGVYKFDMNKLGAAHANCKSRVEGEMLKSSPKIFVANTFTTESEINTYKKLADNHGYMFVSMIIENRHGNVSVHNVPEATMVKMKDRFSIKL
jgi:predicted kinase